MPSPFHFAQVIETISVASERVLPALLAVPSLRVLCGTIVAVNPLVTSFYMMMLQVILQIGLSVVSCSFSWNDRAWPLIPLAHAILFAIHPLLSANPIDHFVAALDARICLMAALVALWSSRLFLHALRRNVYSAHAVDYRYCWIRSNVLSNGLLFVIFYVSVVCSAFTFLLTIVVAPMYFAWISRNTIPLSILDFVATALTALAILTEAVADRQQQCFQAAKNSKTAPCARFQHLEQYDVDELGDGFLQSGLYAWCRHPNFFAELCVWFSFYLFSISAGAQVVNWTITGPLLYLMLFQGSTALTEHIAASKYPNYRHYQARVPRLYPSPFAKRRPATSEGHGKKD